MLCPEKCEYLRLNKRQNEILSNAIASGDYIARVSRGKTKEQNTKIEAGKNKQGLAISGI